MLLEKSPNLALKNKKGQTAIDMANNKLMIALISHFLSGNNEDTKQPNIESKPKIDSKKNIDKIRIKPPEIPQGYEAKQKEKIKITQRPKRHLEVFSIRYLKILAIEWNMWKSQY